MPNISLTRSGRGLWLPLLLLAATGFLSDSVLAQSTRDRLDMLEESQRRLERLMQNNQAVQTDLLQQLQSLQNETRTLRNDVEQLQFESTQSADRQRELYLDLDQRLQNLEQGGVAGAASQGGTGGGGSDGEDYSRAFELLKQAQYPEARSAFQQFLVSYPDSSLRDNAQYWLAETDYVTRDFSQALTGFEKLIAEYPSSRKVADAWLKLGYCNYELQRWSEARRALSAVAAQYSDTTAARLAEQRLAQMKNEGR